LPAFVLITMAVAALAFGLNNLFVPTAAQADSDAALAGREYLQLLAAFDRNPFLIRTHVGLGVEFVLLAAFQFWRQFRNHNFKRHQAIGYVAMACMVFLPITAIACTIVYPFAGPAGIPPNVVWMVAILFCVAAAWRAARRREITDHEAWVTRATAMTVGISLTRLYEPVLVHVFHMVPHAAFGLTFWFGQGEGLLVAEVWLRRPGGPLARKAARTAARTTARA
jgi:uncharacterized membrane protein YozB (DUF420 family)